MRHVTLHIPDEKYELFLETIKNLGISTMDDIEIPEAHKNIVRNRIKNSDPEKLIPWNEAREKFNFKQ